MYEEVIFLGSHKMAEKRWKRPDDACKNVKIVKENDNVLFCVNSL